ncbi:MAG TPA: hypothetical protein VHO48_00865 [Anaerolineaceae bacterium]|nr:hypothetical protein [Anaerolineaceae bacterium]
MNAKLKDLERGVAGYRFVDGLLELGLGVFATGWGGFYLLDHLLAKDNPAGAVLDGLEAVFILAWFFFTLKGVQILKQRITLPRSGYAEPKKFTSSGRDRPFIISMGVMFLLFLVVVVVVISDSAGMHGSLQRWEVTILAGLVAVMFIWNGLALRLRRFILLGLWSLVLGGAIYTLQLPDHLLGRGIYSLAFGASMLLSGVVTLSGYLQNNPPVGEELSE